MAEETAQAWQPDTGDPILDLIVTTVLNELDDTQGQYFLPTVIRQQGKFSSFTIDTCDLGQIQDDQQGSLYSAASSICNIYVDQNYSGMNPPIGIAVANTLPYLALSQVQVDGLANVKLTQVDISGDQRTEWSGNGQFCCYQLASLPQLPTAITLAGTFALALQCCQCAEDSFTDCAPGTQTATQVLGTFTATISAAAAANNATITAQNNTMPPDLTVVVRALEIVCDFDTTPMQFTLTLTNIAPEHRDAYSSYVAEIFQSPYAQNQLLKQLNARLTQADVLADFGSIVQKNLNQIVSSFFA